MSGLILLLMGCGGRVLDKEGRLGCSAERGGSDCGKMVSGLRGEMLQGIRSLALAFFMIPDLRLDGTVLMAWDGCNGLDGCFYV